MFLIIISRNNTITSMRKKSYVLRMKTKEVFQKGKIKGELI